MGLNTRGKLLRASLPPDVASVGSAAYGRLGWLTITTGLSQLAALGSVFLLTGSLGAERFGAFQVALALQFYLQLLASGGLRVVVIAEIVRSPQDVDRVFTAYLVLTAVGGAIVGLATLAGAVLGALPVEQQYLLLLVAAGNFAASVNIVALFDAHHKQPRCAAIALSTELLALGSLALLSSTRHLDLTTAGAVFAAKWALTTAGQFVVYHFTVRRLRLVFSLPLVVRLWRAAWPLAAAALVGSLPLRSGVFFVRSSHGDADAAILSLGVQVASAYLLFAALGNRVLQPYLLGRHGREAGFVRKFALFLAIFLGGLWLLAFGGMTVVVVSVLGSEYRAALVPGALLLLGAAVIAVGDAAATYLVALDRGRIIMLARVGAALAYTAGCLVLVSAFSFNGAAAMTLAASLLGTVSILLAVRARASVSHRRHSKRSDDGWVRIMKTIQVADLKANTIDGKSRVCVTVDRAPLWFESADTVLEPAPEGVASAMWLPCLERGARLALDGPVCPRWFSQLPQLLDILQEWWSYPRLLPRVGVHSDCATAQRPETGLYFTGGVDSFYSLLRGGLSLDFLVFVHGYDIPLRDGQRMASFEKCLRCVSAAVGAKSVIVRTNLRNHHVIFGTSWIRIHGGALAAVGHLLSRALGRIAISCTYPYSDDYPWGSHWRLDPLWSSAQLDVVHLRTKKWRAEKLQAIAHEPLVREHLRVCWENRSQHLNCSRCEKCLRTQLALLQCGQLAHFPVFDQNESLTRRIEALSWIPNPDLLIEYERYIRHGLAPDLARAVERLLDRSRKPALRQTFINSGKALFRGPVQRWIFRLRSAWRRLTW